MWAALGDDSGNPTLGTKLTGRTGSTNNTIISTDDNGQITLANSGASGSSKAGTLYGSGKTGEGIVIQPNSANATSGTIGLNAPQTNLYTSFPASTSSNFDLLNFSNTATLSSAATLNGYDFAPALTMSGSGGGVNGIKFGGTIAVTGTIPLVRGFLFSPTIDYSNVSDPFNVYQVNGVACAPTFTSSTANGALYQDCYVDGTTINYSGASDLTDITVPTGNPWAPISLLINGLTETTGAGDLTINKIVGVQYQGLFDATNSASALTINNVDVVRSAVPACNGSDCGLGTVTIGSMSLVNGNFTSAIDPSLSITTAYGMKLSSWDKAATNITLFSDATGATMQHAGAARFGATGAPTSTYAVDVQGNLKATGTLLLGDNVTDTSSSITNFQDTSPTWDISGGTANWQNFTPTTTQTGGIIVGHNFSPALTVSGTAPQITAVNMAGQSTISSVNGSNFPIIWPFVHTRTYTTSTANGELVNSGALINDNPTFQSTATSGTAHVEQWIGLGETPKITMNGIGGAITVPILAAVDVGGNFTQTNGTMTISKRIGLNYKEATTTGTHGMVDNVAVDVAALTKGSGVIAALRSAITAATGSWLIDATDTAQSRLGGKTIIGSTSGTPSAELHVQQPTNTNEVLRVETVGTNNPNYKIIQTRATAAASSTTNIDFSLTSAAPTDAPCPSNGTCIVQADINCHCTSGSSCTANDGATNSTKWAFKNNAGTITQIGSTTSGNSLPSTATIATAIISGSSITSITASLSTTNFRYAVVVPANFGHVCHVTYFVQSNS